MAQVGQTCAVIDHLVLATPDVAATSATLATRWGIDIAPGGQHVGLGTRNALTGLGGGSYLEVVGPDADQPQPAQPRPFGIDDLHEPTLVAWCARPTRPIPDILADFSVLGITAGPVASMSRQRPDGVLLEWKLTFPLLGHPYHGTVPFLIDWLESPHPTASLPEGAHLRLLRLSHPQPGLLRAAIAAVGHDDRIEIVEGEAGLAASFDTPGGRASL